MLFSTYLGNNSETIANLVQCLTQTRVIMGCVHLDKPKQCSLSGPLAGHALLDPMASHCKVCIRVAGLPRITREADFAFDSGALTCNQRHHNSVSVDENGCKKKVGNVPKGKHPTITAVL